MRWPFPCPRSRWWGTSGGGPGCRRGGWGRRRGPGRVWLWRLWCPAQRAGFEVMTRAALRVADGLGGGRVAGLLGAVEDRRPRCGLLPNQPLVVPFPGRRPSADGRLPGNGTTSGLVGSNPHRGAVLYGPRRPAPHRRRPSRTRRGGPRPRHHLEPPSRRTPRYAGAKLGPVDVLRPHPPLRHPGPPPLVPHHRLRGQADGDLRAAALLAPIRPTAKWTRPSPT